jgi:excisionase family DNA binding protein
MQASRRKRGLSILTMPPLVRAVAFARTPAESNRAMAIAACGFADAKAHDAPDLASAWGNVIEAAKLVGLSVRSLHYLIPTGQLGYSKVGRRVLIPHAELERMLRRGLVKATQVLEADEPIRPRGKNRNASKAATSLASTDTGAEIP